MKSRIYTLLISTLVIQLGILSGGPTQTSGAKHPHNNIKATQQSKFVEKKTFQLPTFTTVGGKTIKNVRVGWESYGKLNKDKNNVILITHYFSGSSHAAGKYSADDKAPGYWDKIIGPGKAIDTNKFFVISSDSLVNLNTKNSRVITTGPISINPDTGRPYAMDFPIVTIRDFVNVQKALLDSLGISKLHTVIGASMGSMQAIEWATAYPEKVDRVILVIGTAQVDDWLIAWLDICSDLIRLDPDWKEGNYYGKKEPIKGLASAIKMMNYQARSPTTLNLNKREWAQANRNPLDNFNNRFKVEATLDDIGRQRAKNLDANHFLYLAKANQMFSAKEKLPRLKARLLLLPAKNDRLIPPKLSREVADIVKQNGGTVKYVEIEGTVGHLDGIISIEKVSPTIKDFLKD